MTNATSAQVASALVFVWLGMVLAISFLEAPLNFRAPGITLQLGLGIGRLVFRALNLVEAVLAVGVIAAVATGGPTAAVITSTAVLAALLVVQLVAIRPVLTRRSDRVLAGAQLPRSRAHVAYVVAEVLKVAALVWLGVSVL